MIVKLLTEHNLEFLSLKGCCTGSSESTLVKLPHCWKSHALAPFLVSIDHVNSLRCHFFFQMFCYTFSATNIGLILLNSTDPDEKPRD